MDLKFGDPFVSDDPDALSPGLLQALGNFPGNTLKADGRAHVRLLFFQLPGAAAEAREFLREIVNYELLTTALDQCRESKQHKAGLTSDRPFRSLALTAKGLCRLGLTDREMPLDSAFRDGMQAKDELVALQDAMDASCRPTDWQEKYTKHDFHGVWLLAHAESKGAERLEHEIATFCNLRGVQIVERESGIRQEREPFGFRDGLSMPSFFANHAPSARIEKWPSVFPLNSVLYAEDPSIIGVRTIDLSIYNGGSFLVFRKLEQDVAAFNQASAKLAGSVRQPSQSDPEATDYAGALIVGRHKDGTPLMPVASPGSNDFNYHRETTGAVCPFQAHIRKSNARQVGPDGSVNSRHVIARRGAVYEEEVAGEKKTGLLFMAYCGSINHGFRFLQESWMNDPAFRGSVVTPEQGVDALMGQPPPAKLIVGTQACAGLQRFVTPRGGEYFFVPPMAWLQAV